MFGPINFYTILFGIAGAQQRIPSEFDPMMLVKFREFQLVEACPEGVASCECNDAPGTNVTNHFYLRDGFLNAMVTYVGCNPGWCKCKRNQASEVDITPWQLKAALRVCPRGKMSRCLCADNSKIKYPWTMMRFWQCKPKKCKCVGNKEVKVVRSAGCKDGGFGKCPKEFELHCKDGTHVSADYYMEWRINRRRDAGCPCSDNSMPICKSTGEAMKCPNGDEVDWFNMRGELEKELAEDVRECILE